MSAEERRALAIEELEHTVGQAILSFTGHRRAQFWSQERLDEALRELRSLRYDPESPYGPRDNDGNRIICRADQERLKREFPHWVKTHDVRWDSVFWHCDNVRVLCEQDRVNVPQWFSEKYGQRFEAVPRVY
jgi:hypothetical protein